jgi:hypothetical protein
MDDWDENEPPSRTGRFHLAHRGGSRVEVGEPIHVGGDKPWLCAVKLLGRDEQESDGEATQTLFVRSGRGATADEARRNALAALSLVVGSPVGPPPEPRISRKVTDPPPSSIRPVDGPLPYVQTNVPRDAAQPGWISRLFGKKGALAS